MKSYHVIARSPCDEAIHTFFTLRDGLLRFARNDGEGCLPTRYSVIARSEATKQSILSFRGGNGLLRRARNDGEGALPRPEQRQRLIALEQIEQAAQRFAAL